jgi:DNA-binding NarL/FixJ family response regulator
MLLKKKTTVFLVDDHAMLREPLASMLQAEGTFDVVGTAESAGAALPLIRERHPDIVLMDIDMAGLQCFEAARIIRTDCPTTQLVFLSAFVTDHFIDQALEVQARGYVTKFESPERIVQAIREVAGGGAFFSEQVRSRIVIDGHAASLSAASRSRAATLTRREREMVAYYARGLAQKEIADLIKIAKKTVEHHITNAMRKLDIHSKAELIRFAVREGIVPP